MSQSEQKEWNYQWDNYSDREQWLFKDWIYPNKLEDFKGKTILDLGCGSGQHISFVAPYAEKMIGVDLNTVKIAKQNTVEFGNVEIIEGDIAEINFEEKFDVVYCVGVIQHTDNPDKTFANIRRFVKQGGKLIVWCYSWEGNFLNRIVLENFKKLIVKKISRNLVKKLAFIMTLSLYFFVYSLYLFPIGFLPYYEYFKNFRRLSFKRNELNVFDKLNAPVTHFIKKDTIYSWFREDLFCDIHISNYKGVSWRVSGNLK